MENLNQTTLNPTLAFPHTKTLTNFEDSDEGKQIIQGKLSFRSKRISKKRSTYQKIDDSIRQKLIHAVTKEGQMIKTVAKKFNINYSSAKSIFHTYRKEGRINKKVVRERFLKINPKGEEETIQTPNLAQSDSESTSETEDTPKHLQFNSSNIDIQKSLKNLQETQALTLPASISNSQIKSFPFNSSQAFDTSSLDQMTNINPQFNYTALANSVQNHNLTQHLIDQANTMRLYEELAQLQGLQRMVMNANPLANYIALQRQMQSVQNTPFGLGNLQNQMACVRTVPSRNVFSTYTFTGI